MGAKQTNEFATMQNHKIHDALYVGFLTGLFEYILLPEDKMKPLPMHLWFQYLLNQLPLKSHFYSF